MLSPGSSAPGVDAVAKAVTATNQIPQALPAPLAENGPLAAVFPDGVKTTAPPNRDLREVFAERPVRPDNPWFAKNIVNRTWARAMGRSIIHEPDDIRDDNPPWNQELLAYSQKELVSSGYGLAEVPEMAAAETARQNAYGLILGSGREVFNLKNEPTELRDRCGRNAFGQECPAARRMVDAGAPYSTISFPGGRDTHSNHFATMKAQCASLDQEQHAAADLGSWPRRPRDIYTVAATPAATAPHGWQPSRTSR